MDRIRCRSRRIAGGYGFALSRYMRIRSVFAFILSLGSAMGVSLANARDARAEISASVQADAQAGSSVTQTEATTTVAETAMSLRLTHLLFAAVLDHYEAEGLEKYRPDFLLHERYLRTFIYEWGLLLDAGSVRSTKEAWAQIAARKSYLGVNFEIWRRTLPNYFGGSAVANGFNIGYRREGFLVRVLESEIKTETKANSGVAPLSAFDLRLAKIVDFVSADLMTEEADQALGAKILESVLSSSNADIRKNAAQTLRNSPRLMKIVNTLRLGRDVVLGIASGGPAAGSQTALTYARIAKYYASSTAKAIRMPELLRASKAAWNATPSIAVATTASIGAHGAAAYLLPHDFFSADDPSSSTAQAPPAIGSDETTKNIPFLAALALNTAPQRASHLVTQNDFEWPKRIERAATKDEWIAQGRQMLNIWNGGGRVKNLAEFFLEGERLLGYWPQDTELARITMLSRYALLKRRIRQGEIKTFDDLRIDVLKNELEDYRGKRRTLTGVFLDWGGNCVSQTVLMVSLLNEFPELLPKGARLGVFDSSTHMEAVVVEGDIANFMVSGKMMKLDGTITILKPQALIVNALSAMGESDIANLDSYYISTVTKKTPFSFSGIKGWIKHRMRFDFEDGLIGRSVFDSGGGSGGPPPNAPDHAKMQISPRTFTSILSGIGSSFESSNEASDAPTKREVKPKPIKVQTPVGVFDFCVTYKDVGQFSGCENLGRLFEYDFAIFSDGLIMNYIGGKGLEQVQKGTQVAVSGSAFRVFPSIPSEFWFLMINQTYLRAILAELNPASDAQIERIGNMTLTADDLSLIASFRGSNLEQIGIERDAPKWNTLLLRLEPNIPRPQTAPASKAPFIIQLRHMLSIAESYRKGLSTRYKNRPELATLLKDDPWPQLNRWQKAYESFFSQIENDPEKFVRLYPTFSPEIKLTLIKLLRADEPSRPFLALQKYVQTLRLKNLNLKPALIESRQPCVPKVEIKTPVCHTEEGCKAFIRRRPYTENCGDPRPLINLRASRIEMTPKDFAELSVMTKIGFSKWDKKILQAADRDFATWDSALINLQFELDMYEDGFWETRSEFEASAVAWLKRRMGRALNTKVFIMDPNKRKTFEDMFMKADDK